MAEPKRALIIPSAGVASRFSGSLGREALKGIFFEDRPQDAILHRLVELGRSSGFSEIVVVGGYRFDELKSFLGAHFPADAGLSIVENSRYATTGTLYSFYLGLEHVFLRGGFDEVVMAEGDLAFDRASFARIVDSPKDVLSACPEPITAERSVAVYLTPSGEVKYVYDVEHRELRIPVPFRAIYNSGQVWKFRDMPRLERLFRDLKDESFNETNLGFIQAYFSERPAGSVEVVSFREWHNCNTIEDFRASVRTKGN